MNKRKMIPHNRAEQLALTVLSVLRRKLAVPRDYLIVGLVEFWKEKNKGVPISKQRRYIYERVEEYAKKVRDLWPDADERPQTPADEAYPSPQTAPDHFAVRVTTSLLSPAVRRFIAEMADYNYVPLVNTIYALVELGLTAVREKGEEVFWEALNKLAERKTEMARAAARASKIARRRRKKGEGKQEDNKG